MNSILKKTGYNVRGVRDIAFLEMFNLTSLPEVYINEPMIDITASVLVADFKKADFTAYTAIFDEKEVDKDGELWYEQTVTFFIAKADVNRYMAFNSMKHIEFLVVIRDQNNKSRVCGFINLQGEKHGMKFKADFTTETVNGFECTFYMDSPQRSIPCVSFWDITFIIEPPIDDNDDIPIDPVD